MSQNVSIEHTIVDVNGHRVSGWAGAADALQLPDQTLANVEVGPDGTMVASSTGMKGGVVTFKLLANSPTTAFFMQQLAQIQRGAVIEWMMTITNPQTGWSVTAERGVMTVSPLGQSLGNAVPPAREFQLHFETIIPNYDGAQTAPVPVQVAA